MDKVLITNNGIQIHCKILKIRGDGACLFSCLSYLVHGDVSMAAQVRADIVRHVSNNWQRFKCFTQQRFGAPFHTKCQYITEMSRQDTYGTTCELIAAGELFPYEFQVFHGGTLLATFGEALEGVKRMLFTGDFNDGHFDILIPLDESANSGNPDNVQQSLTTNVPMESKHNLSCILSRRRLSLDIGLPSSEKSVPSPVTSVKGKRGKKRRKRFTDSIRRKQNSEHSSKYTKKNPENNRTAVKKYTQNKPQVNRQAVKKYTQNKSQVNRQAVKKYTQNKPQVHRQAVKKYTQNKPQVNRQAVKKYTQNKPQVNRQAVKKYAQNKPQVHRQAVKKYAFNNPQVNQEASVKYLKKRSRIISLPWDGSGFKYDPQTDYSKDKIVDLGSRKPCAWCHAQRWQDETPGMCCNNGKTQLPALKPYPEPLHSLITHQHPMSEHFFSAVRKYNGCFQLTSFGAKEVKEGNFMPTFKVQGQVYHRIGSLFPGSQQQPSFLQIYFVGDEDKESDIRCGIYPDLKPDMVKQLQKMLHEHNQYILDFKAAIDSIPEGQKDFKVVINADMKPPEEHRGRFNVPATREVAILIVGQEFEKRDIVLHSRDNTLIRISETHRAYDALQYPLIFCHGEDGYSINVPQRDAKTKAPLKKTVSAVDFYSYRLMERDDEECHLLLFRNLLNQFLVDMYAKIETERLNFIRNNQKKLRSEEYIHLKDAMTRNDGQLSEIGRMVVLPSSFTGGPRYMHEKTQDAMTYVRHFGRPDLFITFTCNPKWPEITELLTQGQKPHDRHDLVARVFHLKVKHMIKLLTKGCIFGSTRCHMYSVEWQKRGLPHVHILLWLEEKIRPEFIDKVIRAEIPDPDLDPVLHEIVKTTMIHGPCGPFNKKLLCMADGTCSKKYPRPVLKETQTGEDGYPQYRRRSPADGGFTVKINDVTIDNRWVVPYNPVLSRTFSAHINVEYCNSVKSIKYICKYVNKGSDQAAFNVEYLDEVTRYETGRYISSSEGAWRILCFPIHERFPPVMHLSVHLENGQRVYFTEKNLVDRINNPRNTTLLGFFELCKEDIFARTLLYCEVPNYYVWKCNKFCRRKQGKPVEGYPGVKKDHVLGRVYTIHPSSAECYYLRLLLHEIRGPTSFTALKTVAGVVQPTFQAACRVLGLLEDDAHWDRTLEEASISDSPNKMRELFAIMLVFCQVGDPIKLWRKYRDNLSEDIRGQMERERGNVQLVLDIVYNLCLILLEDIVISISGKTLQQFELPIPSRERGAVVTNLQYWNELSYDSVQLTEVIAINVPKLNPEQRNAYDEIMLSITSDSGQLFFLDAPAGTGKTFLINLLLATIRREKNIAVAVASSGIAATLIDGGKTAHSAFKLPLNPNQFESALCNISKQSDMAQVLREAKVIVWDEVTMAHKRGIEALNKTLQDIRGHNQLMGGVTVLLSGDFRQTLPVTSRGTRADEVKNCLKSSILWPNVKILRLRTNMRVHLQHSLTSEDFSKLLMDIGDGNILEEDGKINIPNNLCVIVPDLISLTDRIYPNIYQAGKDCASWLKERAILTPTNDSANIINNFLLEKLPTELIKYESVDSVVEVEDAVHYPVEFLHTLNPPGIPPHVLNIKVGAPVMMLRNLSPPKLCNGTRLQVKALYKHVIEAKIITGVGQGEIVFIPRIPLIPSDYQFAFKRLQFPVRVCYAMTINKAQGQSLRMAGVDLRSDCFSHGQLYVACSRVSSPDSLVILQPNRKTRNIVYREVLRN